MALMSDSCPVKVCRHIPSRTSQSLAEASQAPETNSLVSGARDRLMTSPVCPVNVVVCWPVSMSHRALEQEQMTRYEHTWPLCQCEDTFTSYCIEERNNCIDAHTGSFPGHLTAAKGWLSFHSRSCEVLSHMYLSWAAESAMAWKERGFSPISFPLYPHFPPS